MLSFKQFLLEMEAVAATDATVSVATQPDGINPNQWNKPPSDISPSGWKPVNPGQFPSDPIWDADGDGEEDTQDPDDDNDGVDDFDDFDDDGDNVPDWVDPDWLEQNRGEYAPEDLEDYDNDGIPDMWDNDFDGNGIPDGEEPVNDDLMDDVLNRLMRQRFAPDADPDNDGFPNNQDPWPFDPNQPEFG